MPWPEHYVLRNLNDCIDKFVLDVKDGKIDLKKRVDKMIE